MWTALLLIALPATTPAPQSGEPMPPSGQTWFVSQAGSGLGTGTAQDPFTNISYAISRPFVVSGDEVIVSPGNYENEELEFLGKSLSVRSTQGPAVTTITARRSFSVGATYSAVKVRSGESDVRIEGFRFTGGTGSPECTGFIDDVGGAIAICAGSSVTVADCVFQGNSAARGGAIFAQDAYLELTRCVFLGPGNGTRGEAVWIEGSTASFEGCVFRDFFQLAPSVPQGGGTVVADTSTLSLDQCVFERAATRFFGAHLWSRSSQVSADECVFGSSVGYAGASIAASFGSLRLAGCTVKDALAISSPGAGLFTAGTIVNIDGCLFENNTVTGPREGGAIHVQAGRISITDTHFVGNSAGQGGAISVLQGAGTSIDRCSFFENSAPSGGGAISIVDAIPLIRRSTFIGNEALPAGFGGAVQGRAILERCTLTGNVAGGRGGAVSNQTQLFQSIAWRNIPGDLDTDTSASYSLVGHPGSAPISNPVFGDPRFWSGTDVHLLPGSAAIDSGPLDSGLDPDGSRTELGAFPFDPFYCPDGCRGSIASEGCTSVPNSTGQIAELFALGSSDETLDRLVIVGTKLPPRAPSLLLASQTAGSTVVPGILGPICLGGMVSRIRPVAPVARPDGSAPYWVRLSPEDTVFAGLPGETWQFQLWYRDSESSAQARSNTSNSIAVTLR